MRVNFYHGRQEVRVTLSPEEVTKIRRWFEKQIHMEWPDDVDDSAALEDALKEIIDDEG